MHYSPPKITDNIVLELEHEILGASAVIEEDVEVTSVGQEVITIDASEFTSSWE